MKEKIAAIRTLLDDIEATITTKPEDSTPTVSRPFITGNLQSYHAEASIIWAWMNGMSLCNRKLAKLTDDQIREIVSLPGFAEANTERGQQHDKLDLNRTALKAMRFIFAQYNPAKAIEFFALIDGGAYRTPPIDLYMLRRRETSKERRAPWEDRMYNLGLFIAVFKSFCDPRECPLILDIDPDDPNKFPTI